MKENLLLWGWLRLFIGLAQIGFVVAAVWIFCSSSFCLAMWVCVFGASIATLLSRYLFWGRKHPSKTVYTTRQPIDVAAHDYETSVFQLLQMMRESGVGDAEFVLNVTDDQK